MNSLWAKIPQGRVKFKVGDLVRITKEKVRFSKVYGQTFSTEIFRVAKVIERAPQYVYELTDLQGRPTVLQLRACQGHCFTPDGV